MNLSGKKAKKWLKDHFASTWEYFDVNKDGLIEVERIPQFLRWSQKTLKALIYNGYANERF